MKHPGLFLLFALFSTPFLSAQSIPDQEECTIGAASGRATKDGRPMIWKTRDTGEDDNAVALFTSFPIPFLAVVDAGNRTSSWMSLNARGFAILNSIAYDLTAGSSGLSNGTLMAYASGNCATVADFEHLLDSTNVTGRRTNANFVVMDSTGVAAIFETAGNAYWKFDATDSVACPAGYILRTNFTVTGGGLNGIERFNRTTTLFQSFSAGDSITPKTIFRHQTRDFADPSGVPYAIPYPGSIYGAPYGFIPANLTICRTISRSAAVMQGILPGETAAMSTFWVLLGCPVAGIAVPYWNVGPPPTKATDAPYAMLTDTSKAIFNKIWGGSSWSTYINSSRLRNANGTGLLPTLYTTEDQIFHSADSLLALWRTGQATSSAMLAAEGTYVDLALNTMRSALQTLNTTDVELVEFVPAGLALEQNYPNPFNPMTIIDFRLAIGGAAKITVVDVLGREVAVLVDEVKPAGRHSVSWNAGDQPSGVYFYTIQTSDFRETKRMMLVR